MSIKNVTVWGGTGNLGPAIVHALVEANFTVSLLSRSAERPAHIPSSVAVKQVSDFKSQSVVTAALKGQDAVISTAGTNALALQSEVVDAAIAAGVKLFIPSEFGCDTENPKAAKLPVFGAKIAVQEHLRRRAQEGKIAYTLVNNGPFLDWGLTHGFLVEDLTGNRPSRVFDGGDNPYSTTTLPDIAKAVVGVLRNPERYQNRSIKIHSAIITQNQLIAAAKKVAAKDASFETVPTSTDDIYNESMKVLQSGQGDIGSAMIGFLFKAISDPTYGNVFGQEDSDALGIKRLSDAEIDALVAKSLKEIA